MESRWLSVKEQHENSKAKYQELKDSMPTLISNAKSMLEENIIQPRKVLFKKKN